MKTKRNLEVDHQYALLNPSTGEIRTISVIGNLRVIGKFINDELNYFKFENAALEGGIGDWNTTSRIEFDWDSYPSSELIRVLDQFHVDSIGRQAKVYEEKGQFRIVKNFFYDTLVIKSHFQDEEDGLGSLYSIKVFMPDKWEEMQSHMRFKRPRPVSLTRVEMSFIVVPAYRLIKNLMIRTNFDNYGKSKS